MNKVIVEQKLPEITRKIVEGLKPEKIILFGSYAWGKPSPDSDVDLFIVKDTKKKRIERGVEVERILWKSGIPVDALVYTPKEVERRLSVEDNFIKNIFRKGKVLYSTS